MNCRPRKVAEIEGIHTREQMESVYLRMLPPSQSAYSDSSFADTFWLSPTTADLYPCVDVTDRKGVGQQGSPASWLESERLAYSFLRESFLGREQKQHWAASPGGNICPAPIPFGCSPSTLAPRQIFPARVGCSCSTHVRNKGQWLFLFLAFECGCKGHQDPPLAGSRPLSFLYISLLFLQDACFLFRWVKRLLREERPPSICWSWLDTL